MARRQSTCKARLGFIGALLTGALAALSLWRDPSGRAAEPAKPAQDEKWTVKPITIAAGAKPEPADNSYCYVCHANYEEEELTEIHHAVGVGCETCHGMSMKHSEDENNVTPPDIMWPADRINSRCMTCHLQESLLAGDQAVNHRSFFERLARPAENNPGEDYCTQCHAIDHKLPHRTRIWDRQTGKLLQQTGGPAMDR